MTDMKSTLFYSAIGGVVFGIFLTLKFIVVGGYDVPYTDPFDILLNKLAALPLFLLIGWLFHPITRSIMEHMFKEKRKHGYR